MQCRTLMIGNTSFFFHNRRGLCSTALQGSHDQQWPWPRREAQKAVSDHLLKKHNRIPSPNTAEDKPLHTHSTATFILSGFLNLLWIHAHLFRQELVEMYTDRNPLNLTKSFSESFVHAFVCVHCFFYYRFFHFSCFK